MSFAIDRIRRSSKALDNVRVIERVIAREYLYPSYAYVELSPKLVELAERADVVEVDDEGRLVIDGVKYVVDLIDEVGWFEYADSRERREVMRGAKRLYMEFNKRSRAGELVAFLENSNPDFYVAALFEIKRVE